MSSILRIVLAFTLLVSTAFAEQLEIKPNGKSIKLPYWSALKDPHGAVILINGNAKPQWSQLLERLAKQMSANKWSAVLLNCSQDQSEPWVKQLPEVVNTLRQQKVNRIIVVHYGAQLQQTLGAVNKAANVKIEGLIFLSAYDMSKADDKKPELSMPLLDVIGQFDYASVVNQVKLREKEFAQDQYLVIKIPGAHHDYQYSEQLLLSFIYGWMQKLAGLQPPPVLTSYIEAIEPYLVRELAMKTESYSDDWEGFIDNPPEPTQDIQSP